MKLRGWRLLMAALVGSMVHVADVSAQSGPGRQPDATSGPTPPAASLADHHQLFKRRFDSANTTHDGKLTKAQAQAAGMTRTVKHFDEIDCDHKGYVTMEDIRNFVMSRRQEKLNEGPAPSRT